MPQRTQSTATARTLGTTTEATVDAPRAPVASFSAASVFSVAHSVTVFRSRAGLVARGVAAPPARDEGEDDHHGQDSAAADRGLDVGADAAALVTFGVGVFIFLVVILAAAFRRWRWVLLPLATCVLTSVMMIGILGRLDWRVTVVSSNFVALILILCLHHNENSI